MVDEPVEELSNQTLETDISGIEPGEELYHIDEPDVGKQVEVTREEREAAEAVLSFHFYAEHDSESDKIREQMDKINGFREKNIIKAELEFLYDEDYLEEVGRKLEDRNMNKRISEFQKDDAIERDDFVEIEEELIKYLIGEKYSGESSDSRSMF